MLVTHRRVCDRRQPGYSVTAKRSSRCKGRFSQELASNLLLHPCRMQKASGEDGRPVGLPKYNVARSCACSAANLRGGVTGARDCAHRIL